MGLEKGSPSGGRGEAGDQGRLQYKKDRGACRTF